MAENSDLSPIMVGMAIRSLRNSGFDVYSAIYEVIDNSLDADAKNIQVNMKTEKPPGKHKPRLKEIAFGDDGIGMDLKTLQYCLKIGYSSRYDNRNGIGRFGVGMTIGAINVCQRIEVYSREKRGNWNYTFLDISQIDDDKEPELHHVEPKDLPKEYVNLVGDCGTLVIWSKMDRAEEAFDQEELIHKIGRIYRKFIGQEIIKNDKVIENPNTRKIFINNEIISSHDPLYATKTLKFPNDEVAELEPESLIDWPVHHLDINSTNVKTGKIAIRTSLLPESWRMQGAKLHAQVGEGQSGSGSSPENKKRHVPDNGGISILRKGREVFYGTLSGIGPSRIPIDMFWGCEIDFDPVLDNWFSVKNIKIGAKPLLELKNELHTQLNGAIKTKFRTAIQDRHRQTEEDKSKEKSSFGDHTESEDVLSQITTKPESLPQSEITKNVKESSEQFPEKDKDEYLEKLKDPNTTYVIIENKHLRSDSNFIDIIDNVGKKVVHYNMKHPFFTELYGKINAIEEIAQKNNPENTDLIRLSRELKVDLDKLIYGYAEGRHHLSDDQIQKIEDTVHEHLVYWSTYLRKAYK